MDEAPMPTAPMPMPPPMHVEARHVLSGRSRAHLVLRSRLAFLLLSTLALDAVGTVLMYLLEHDERGSGFTTIGGAAFWVSAQLTTVSSQMPNPLTTGGRIIDLGLEVWAISVVATLAASLAAFFRERHVEDAWRHHREAELNRRAPPTSP
jgi:hypothetical protein